MDRIRVRNRVLDRNRVGVRGGVRGKVCVRVWVR